MNDLPPLQPQEVPWPSIEDVDPSAFVVPSSTVLFAAPGAVPAAAIQQPVAAAAATAAAVPATAGPSGGAPATAAATAKASGAPPAAATRKWASAEDWERHRAIISELYQHRRLKDVVDHMERVYDFYATERMYKFRIKTWGLKKNYRADAVQKAIQRLEQGRIQEADGDLAAGAAQDLPKLDLPRLQRYLRRNPAALQRLRQSQGAGTAEITIPELQALLASAAARSAYAYAASSYGAGAGGNNRSGSSGSSKSPSPPFPPGMAPAGAASAAFHRPLLPNKMRASPQLEAPDEILHLLRTYINGSYRDGRTPEQLAGELTAVGDRDEVMLDFVLKFRAAHAMIAEQQLRVGFYCLRVCFERIEKVLRDGEACARRVLLLYLLNAALDVSVDFAMPEVVQILFRHVRSLAESLLGPNHPAAAIARRFSQLDPSEHVSVLKLTRRLIREDLEGFETETETSGGGGGGGGGNGISGATAGKQPGVAAPADLGRKAISEPALTLYNSTLEQSRGSVEDIAEGLERMRLKTHEVVRDNWLIRLWIAMRVSVAMYEQGRGDEVEDLMLGGFPTCPPRRQPDRVNLMARCFWLRGEKRTEEGRLVEGEQHFRLYIELAETTWGPLDDTVVTTMPLLRDNLLLQGKTDEAEKVQKEWHRRLNERQKERERSK